MSQEMRENIAELHVNLLHIETHSKALALAIKHQLYYSENQSSLIVDMKKTGVEYRENSEILLEFLLNSFTLLNDNLSTQIATISEL